MPHVTVLPRPPSSIGGVAPHTLSVIRISAVVEAALMWMVFVPSLALNFVFGITHISIRGGNKIKVWILN